MKRLLIILGLCAAFSASYAQEKILLTPKGEWTTDTDKATSYVLVYPKEKEQIKVEEFTLDGRKISVTHYTQYKEDRRKRVKQGLYTTFYENGQDSLVVNYEDNKKMGQSNTYFPDGTLRFMCHFENGRLNGKFVQYYRDGSLRREEFYENGKCTGGKLFNRKGEELEHEPYQIFPEFPHGGMAALMKLIAKVVKYPKDAQKAKIEGKVHISFVVDQEGKMIEPKLIKKVYPSIDEEALRAFHAIAAAYRWKPGYIDGKPKKVKFTVPLNFRLTR